ncbi:hypothetical protein niasHS_007114 [Heterodera schachtii]|uniref:GCS light chain n=1 Tax=Heterodera schachtii TaxID=97005 RepID=A0ABD2JL32_HETSC
MSDKQSEGDNSPTKRAHCATKWHKMIDKLHQLKRFRLHTGNINNYVELKLKRFTNSAEELTECLKLMMNCVPDDTHVNEDGTLLLADKKHCENKYERDDLNITLKLFMETFEFRHLKDATGAVLKQLDTDVIEQLIIAFPSPDETATKDGEVDKHWLEQVIRIWKEAETELVDKGIVTTLGVADFQISELRKLWDDVRVKPRIVHVFIEGCCAVPPELQEFARNKNIQLLTHNDPRPFPLTNVFRVFCSNSTAESEAKCDATFCPIWAARYSVWVRRRSLMAEKGFIVQFVTSAEKM